MDDFDRRLAQLTEAQRELLVRRLTAIQGSEATAGDGALVAYVVPRKGHHLSGRELRAYLKQQLPDHMVPASFTLLDALPRTGPGKLDHRALPAPEWERAGGETYVAPSSWAERQMAAIWQDVLKVPEVGLTDDFFELGGHSLLAARVVARAREVFRAELPIRAIFESPTIQGLVRHLPARDPRATAIPPASRSAWMPLSFAQERLWILHQLEPDGCLYNMAGGVRLEGALDPNLLRLALVALVERHEILRTRFALVNGQPRQRVTAEPALPFELVEAASLTPAQLDQALVRDASGGFELSQGPLIRARLYRVSPQLHVLSLVLHHIVADGWSIDLFIREVSEGYAARSRGEAPELAPMALQYVDYAHWQRAHAHGPDLENKLARATRRLAGAPHALELPTDRVRPVHPSFRGGAFGFPLPRALTDQVDAVARQQGLTPFMVALTAFKALLARYARRGDIVVGTPVAGRDRRELEGLVGCFVNTVVLRTDLEPADLSVRDALARVKLATLAAFEDQDLPFDQLVDRLEPVRDPSIHPLFQVVFVMNLDGGARSFQVGGLTARPLDVRAPTAKFDLTLTLDETDDGLRATFEYASDLFDATTIERMAGHYLALLRGVCADLDAPLWRLPMLGPDELRILLTGWNAPAVAAPDRTTVLERFEHQARRRPDATAIRFGARWLSYAELDARANRLARRLRERGVGPEARVAIYLERSPELVIAALAILKAQGAYVPLDLAYPPERVEFALADAGVLAVITERTLAARLSVPDRLLVLDPDDAELPPGPAAGLGLSCSPDQLAYVIYTSGSSGKPKGVEITHGNLARLFTATDPWFGFDERDVWTLFHSFAFDFSVWEMWGALAYGGQLVVVPHDVARSPAEFCRLLADEGVTVLNQTPSAFRQLIVADAALQLPLALRHVIFGGEALELQSLRPWFTRHGDDHPRLVNMYGITETTVHVTYRPIRAADLEGATASPIGRPIPDLQTYLLDEHGNLAPIGVPGEICVGGAGVARGYLGRPELTSQRFVPDPFTSHPGARLYRSGDLGRYRADGDIEYLGRIDHQVKIRGFRIEPGEIEAVARRHPGVQDVAVVPYARDKGDTILAAYVVGSLSAERGVSSIADLRAHLGRELPDYMIPAAFVVLERLPLTANGKLDRRALPDPLAARLAQGGAAPARNAVEAALVSIWTKLLVVDRVGIHDNFFELGGDSILAIQVAAAAREAGWQITPKQLFQHQTIAGLASIAVPCAAPAVDQGPVTGPVPVAPAQAWLHAQQLPRPSHWNQTVLLECRTRLAEAPLEAALAALHAHHDMLRFRAVRGPDGWDQRIDPVQGELPLAVIVGDDPATVHAEADRAQAGLDLAHGPVVRAVLFQGARDSKLLLTAHHLVVDGVSWRILLEDLERAYLASASGAPIALPAKTSPFAHWVHALAERAGAAQAELGYWRDQVSCRDAVVLPDRSGGRNLEGLVEEVEIEFEADETQDVLSRALGAYRLTTEELLLAALASSSGQLAGIPQLVVDLEGHGRQALDGVDVTRTVGWFTSIFPVALGTGRGDSPRDLLRTTKEAVRRVPHRGLHFGLLRQRGSDDLPDSPASVSFNYLGQLDASLTGSRLFAGIAAAPGHQRAPEAPRRHAVEVTASVLARTLTIRFAFSRELHRRDTIERWAAGCAAELRRLSAHCRSPEAGGYSPSDFPLAALDQRAIDALLPAGAEVQDVYPLSPIQEGFLFHGLSSAGTAVGIEQCAFTLVGSLDARRFEQAWQIAIARHDILRTRFVEAGLERPLQIVEREVAFALEHLDWRGAPPDQLAERRAALLDEDIRRGFDPARPPLLRVALADTDNGHVVVFRHHHLLLDGWSVSLLLAEIVAIYRALVQGAEPERARARSYREFIVWRGARDTTRDAAFWRHALRGFRAPTPLGIDRVVPRRPSPGHHEHQRALSREQTAALDTFARAHHVTMSSVLIAAWGLLLGRHGDARDVVFGITVGGRPPELQGVDKILGPFINVTPCRVRPEPDESLGRLVERLHAEQIDQRVFEHTPLVEVQDASEVPAHLPLFDSLLVFENYPARAVLVGGADGSGLRVSGVETAVRTRYRLTLVAVPGDALTLHASYEDDGFDPDLIDRLLEQLANVLDAIATRPDTTVSALDPRTEPERRALVLGDELERALPRGERGAWRLEDADGRGVPDGIIGELVWDAGDGGSTRTGVLVRRGSDGAVEVFGSQAEVFEIHGARVVPAELERLLTAVDGVTDAAVGLRPGVDGQPELWAYLVPGPHGAPSRDALVAALHRRLPAIMVPAVFAIVAALPRHPDGRIDRARVGALGPAELRRLAADGAAPATETERALARLWAELLAVPAVAASDDFFDLGAQSVLVVRLISRIRDVLRVELPARAAFQRRTLRAMADAIDALRGQRPGDEQRSIFERRPLVGGPLREHYELSPYQLPEFYFAEMAPDSPMYNQLLCDVMLRGTMDKAAMTRAWQTLLDRHPILRAHFGYRDGKPMQIVGPRRAVREADLFEDRRHVPDHEFTQDSTAMAHAFAATALDFKHGPMFHLKFVEYTGDRFLIVFLTNHAVWDEVSSLNFVAELRTLYNGFRAGQDPQLPELEVSYFDYAEWVNRNLRDGALARERRYWLQRFADNPDPLELPTDFPRPPVMTFEGSDVSGAIPTAAALALNHEFLRRDPTITLSMFLHAVLNLLLLRWTRQADITIGMPIAGRGHRKLEPVLGPFATGMLMRCQLDEAMTFQQLLEHTRDVTIEALDHYAYPSVLAIQDINPRWDVSRGRLFSVMYGLQHNKTAFWRDTMQLDGMTTHRLPHLTGIGPLHSTSRTDLRLIVEEFGDEIQYSWSFNSDLFKRSSIERLARQYDALIEQVIADPARPLWAYDLVSTDERGQLLERFAVPDAGLTPGARGTVHELFARQVAARPDAPALQIDGGQVTYRELDQAANRVAHLVVGRGVRVEDRVALIFEPCTYLVAAMLGVLKAGACYVPISPDLPEDRRNVVLREAGCRLVLSHAACAPAQLPAGVEGILLDDPELLAARSDAPPEVDVSPGNLAAVFFTSGSTGTPKGVQIEHRGIANVVTSTQASHALHPDEATLLTAPSHVDVSVLDVFWPLTAGAQVAIPTAAETRNPVAIAARVRRHGVAVLQVVPTMLGAMLDAAETGALGAMDSLRHLMCGSAALSRSMRDRCLATFGARLSNNYGPSETTVDACRFDATRAFDGDIVPIGRPIADTRMYVLDAHLQPVPVGVPGEIYISTVRVARGYLGRPDLTAERFVPDPFSCEPGARMYRTGDLGKFDERGELVFLGRVDRQVKIRGNRVELEEIEAHLASHPGIGKHAVTAVRAPSGEQRIAAFIELRASVNRIAAPEGVLRVHTLAQRPDLAAAADALHRVAWPVFFLGDAVVQTLWPRLAPMFGANQLVLATERGEPVAAVNSIPIRWDGQRDTIPPGWDAALTAGFADAEARRPCNTLVVLAAVVAERAAGRGLSTLALRAIKEVARAQELTRVLVPVRPTGKAAAPDMSFEAWCQLRRPDGLAMDNWIRVHERLGAVAVRADLRSQSVRADLASWEAWTGRRFRTSGEYVIEGALAPVRIDIEQGIGDYLDPCLWMEHPVGEPAFVFDPIDPKTLRAWMHDKLPDYMVPEQIRVLDALPLTPSGKVDFKALPALDEGRAIHAPVLPSGELEERLHQIWTDVLRTDRFGVTDSFFEVGGHSIHALQMLAKITDAFGVELPLKRLFAEPTISALASALSRMLEQPPPAEGR